jgi:hypothetical protein
MRVLGMFGGIWLALGVMGLAGIAPAAAQWIDCTIVVVGAGLIGLAWSQP